LNIPHTTSYWHSTVYNGVSIVYHFLHTARVYEIGAYETANELLGSSGSDTTLEIVAYA